MQLDPKNRKNVKYCPCGKPNRNKKRSLRFIPSLESDKHGYCYSQDNGCLANQWGFINSEDGGSRQSIDRSLEPADPFEYLSKQEYKDILYDATATVERDGFKFHRDNNFIDFLYKSLGVEATRYILKDSMLGVTTTDSGVVFPYFDEEGNLAAFKTMHYSKSGNRKGSFNFTRAENNPAPIPFYGLHRLNKYPEMIINIVESEKTRDIMSVIRKGELWMASSGKSGLTKNKLLALKGRNVCLYPDVDAMEDWSKKMIYWIEDIPSINFTVSDECQNYFNAGLLGAKDDIADYYLKLIKENKTLIK